MGKPGNTGIRRILRATVYSLQGFDHAFRNEAAFRQELALFVIMAPTALWLGRDIVEKAVLIAVLLENLSDCTVASAPCGQSEVPNVGALVS